MSRPNQEDRVANSSCYSHLTHSVSCSPASREESSAAPGCSDGHTATGNSSPFSPPPIEIELIVQVGHITDPGSGVQLLHGHRADCAPALPGKPSQEATRAQLPTSKHEHHAKNNGSSTYFFGIISTILLPFIGLVVWLALMYKEHRGTTTVTTAQLGGHFSQPQAKVIDFICSAVLAPLLMAAVNFVWFSCARICVANEVESSHRASRGISLQALTTASSQSTGTYSPFVLWNLVKGRTWRLAVLGSIALFSAVGTSALSNIIAYDSFTEDVASGSAYTLRLLSDPYITHDSQNRDGGLLLYGFSIDQQNIAGKNVSSMFNDLTFVSAGLDGDGGYIGTNATATSMNAVIESVSTLDNVPGYRLTANCTPTKMLSNSYFAVESAGTGYTQFFIETEMSTDMRVSLNLSADTEIYFSSYEYAGSIADVFFDMAVYNEFLTFGSTDVAGGDISSLVTLVHFETGTLTTSNTTKFTSPVPMETKYGTVDPVYKQVIIPAASQGYESMPMYPLAIYTLQCSLYKQDGMLNFTRQSDKSWEISSHLFDAQLAHYASFLPDWTMRCTETRNAPPLADTIFSTASNDDPTGAPTMNFTAAINNLIYASGEVERIAYNVASLNTSHDQPDYFYNVTGNVGQEFYRITYVPALLLVGMVCIILCASMTMALVLSVRQSASWKMFRVVDTVRLVIDAVGGGLTEDTAEFAKLARAGKDEITDWAKMYKVAYEKTLEETDGEWRLAVSLVPHLSGTEDR